jgi:hypothetical protein
MPPSEMVPDAGEIRVFGDLSRISGVCQLASSPHPDLQLSSSPELTDCTYTQIQGFVQMSSLIHKYRVLFRCLHWWRSVAGSLGIFLVWSLTFSTQFLW